MIDEDGVCRFCQHRWISHPSHLDEYSRRVYTCSVSVDEPPSCFECRDLLDRIAVKP